MADPLDAYYGRPRRQKKQPIVQALTPEEEPGVIASLGNNALSGLGFVGNVLDTPGSIIRGLAVGKNPLPGIFDPEQRTSGRDVLESYGLADPNQAGADLGDVAGFGAEIALDPLTYLTLGGSALGKFGKAAKNAGLLDDASRIATKQAGKQVGKRGARLALTAEDLLQAMPEKREAFNTAAMALGLDPAKAASEKLGGMGRIGLPFSDSGMVFGQGKTAQKLAGGMDAVGEAMRYGKLPGTNYSPGMHAAELFDYRVQGASTKSTQKQAAQAMREYEAGAANVDLTSQLAADHFNQMGLADTAGGETIRHMAENPAAMTGTAGDGITPMKQYTAEALTRKQAEGLDPGVLKDTAGIDYFPRRMTKQPSGKGASGGAGIFKSTDPSDIARLEELKGIHGGTTTLKEIASDPNIPQIKAAIQTGGMPADSLAGYIAQKYGPHFVDPDTIAPLAETFKRIDDNLLETGLFGNHPVVDFQTYGHGVERSVANAKAAKNVIAEHAATVPSFDPTTHIRVQDVMEKLGFDTANFPQYQSSQIGSVVMPLDEAKSLLKMKDGFKSPEAVGKLMGGLDSFMNLWKAGVLTRPARYTRDLVSGGVRGVEEGVLNPRGFTMFQKLITGKAADGAEKIPAVAKILKDNNLPDSKASDVLRSLIAANGMAGNKQAAGNVVGNLAPNATGGLEDLLGARPGHHPSSLKEFGNALFGKGPDSTWNPRKAKIRGVAGATDTTFAPVKAGEVAGHYTDSANRVPGFIELLWQGVDPHTAAKRINDAQVDYSARTFTPFERDVMKRVVPFYSFTKKQVPYVAKTLAEKPGGMLAQEIRALNQAGKDDQPLPDKVTSGTAIPLGEQEDGTKRFLTSTGNMAEDVLTLPQIGDGIGDTISKTGRQLLGRVHPLIKAPIELSTGKLLFSGQNLSDADPSIGRAISNVKDSLTGSRTIDAPGKGDDLAGLGEYAAGFIPGVSTIANTVRTAADPRKTAGDKALNLLSGAKVSDISPSAQEAVLVERVKDKLLKSGGRMLERPYIPNSKRENAAPGELDAADRLLSLLKLHDQRRNKANAKPKPKKHAKSDAFPF